MTVLAAVAAHGQARPSADTTRRVHSIKDSPGYVPLVDPESTSVRLGRRLNAPLVGKPFRGGARSFEDLGRRVCRALHREQPDSLWALCITEDEFRDILWREFPESRPVTGIEWQESWMFLYARLRKGCRSAVLDFGGQPLTFVRFEPLKPRRFRNFTLYEGLAFVARDSEGKEQRYTWLRAIAERKGVFKIYSTQD